MEKTVRTRKKILIVAGDKEVEVERQVFDLEYGNHRRIGDDTVAAALDHMERDAAAYLAPGTVYELRSGLHGADDAARVVAWYADGEMQRLPVIERTDKGSFDPDRGITIHARQKTPSAA